jgi:hypothetical protein
MSFGTPCFGFRCSSGPGSLRRSEAETNKRRQKIDELMKVFARFRRVEGRSNTDPPADHIPDPNPKEKRR